MNYKIISVKNLHENIEYYRNFATQIVAVVKADAYGHGVRVVAEALEGKVDYFAVFSPQEAKNLSKIVPNAKIIILSHVSNFALIDKYYLTATTLADVKKAILRGATNRCFIKLSAGMNRFGIDCKNQNTLEKLKKLIKNYDFAGFSLHFSTNSCFKCAQKEFASFLEAKAQLGVNYPVCFGGSHAKNFACDILRVGIGMYGYGEIGLKKVMTTEGEVLSVRSLEKGEKAGYEGAFKAKRRTNIAIVSVGYGDGFVRDSRNWKCSINGKKYKIIAPLNMDTFMLDVTGSDVKVGDRVSICDDYDVYCKFCHGNIYETLTRMSLFRGKTIKRN